MPSPNGPRQKSAIFLVSRKALAELLHFFGPEDASRGVMPVTIIGLRPLPQVHTLSGTMAPGFEKLAPQARQVLYDATPSAADLGFYGLTEQEYRLLARAGWESPKP